MELRHYYEVLRKRVWIMALLIVVIVSGVVLQITRLSPKYEAEVDMLVTPRVTAPTAFEDAGPPAFPGAEREAVLKNVALLIQSREVLQRVADKTGESTAEGLSGRVEVVRVAGSDFLLVKAKHDDPERAALLANTVAQEFLNFYEQINRREATGAQQFIEEQLRFSRDRLRAAEQALLDFETQSGVVGVPQESSGIVQRALSLEADQQTAALEERMAQTRIDAIQQRLRSENDARLASVSIATNPVVGQLRTHLMQLELDLATSRQVNTDEHPKVKELLGAVADARARLREEAGKVIRDESLGVSPIREGLVREMVTGEVDAVVAHARAAGLGQILGEMRGKQRKLPQRDLTLARFQRDVHIAEESFTRLSTLYQEAVIRESKAGSSGQAAVVLVDAAKVPEEPVSNQLPIKAGAAGLLGLVVGAALALLVDSLDDRIRSAGQAERAYGVPVLGAIPTMNAGSHRYLTVKPGASASLLLPTILVLIGLGIGVGLAVTPVESMPHTLVSLVVGLIQALPSL